jgi:hypothetical protein
MGQRLQIEQTQQGVIAIVTSNMITHSGQQFGLATIAHQIPMFEGARKLQDLAVYPLQYYQNGDELCRKAVDRGKKLRSILPHKYVETSGFAMYEENKPFRLEVSILLNLFTHCSKN